MSSLICQKRYAIVIATDRGPCSYVRFRNWQHLLNSTAGGECEIIVLNEPIWDDYLLYHAASVTIARPHMVEHFEWIRRLYRLKGKHRFSLQIDYDDLLWSVHGEETLPPYNPWKGDTTLVRDMLHSCLPMIDKAMVSTLTLGAALKAEFPAHGEKVVVVPNFAFTSLYWDEAKPRRKRPLVAYTGSTSHFNPDDPGDLSGPWIPAIKEAIAKKLIDFHCFGPDLGPFEGINATLHKHQYASLWPQYLSRLAPDVIIAPLKDNLFNRCKSPIKALEAALVGSAFIGSIFPRSPYADYLTPATAVMDADEPAVVLKAFELLSDDKLRQQNAEYVASQVLMNGLIAEAPPATDCILSALFGRFLKKTGE